MSQMYKLFSQAACSMADIFLKNIKKEVFVFLFNVECDGDAVSFPIHGRQRMFAGRRLQGNPVEVLRGGQVVVIQMPEDGGLRVAVRQFRCDEAGSSIQLPGKGDAGIHGRINELQSLDSIPVVTGFKRRKRPVFRMMLFVVPFPDGREGEP